MSSQLEKEAADLSAGIQNVMNRLHLVIDAFEYDPNNPEPFTVQGATAVLKDTLEELDGILASIHEGTELSKHLGLAEEVAHG